MPSSCVLLGARVRCYDNIAPRGFAISARDNSGEREVSESACTRSVPGICLVP